MLVFPAKVKKKEEKFSDIFPPYFSPQFLVLFIPRDVAPRRMYLKKLKYFIRLWNAICDLRISNRCRIWYWIDIDWHCHLFNIRVHFKVKEGNTAVISVISFEVNLALDQHPLIWNLYWSLFEGQHMCWRVWKKLGFEWSVPNENIFNGYKEVAYGLPQYIRKWGVVSHVKLPAIVTTEYPIFHDYVLILTVN